MKINIITVGKNMPTWIKTGFTEYAKRLSDNFKLQLKEISPASHIKTSDLKRALYTEGQRMLEALSPDDFVIALDERGAKWNTLTLANNLKRWQESYQGISFFIGGPDGLAPECLARAALKWSLSDLTLPHQLVRVIVAEQIYRAWTILKKHPYHRS
jgi:23S rRNA (pseudouridine1915-N3)-methyltransferase